MLDIAGLPSESTAYSAIQGHDNIPTTVKMYQLPMKDSYMSTPHFAIYTVCSILGVCVMYGVCIIASVLFVRQLKEKQLLPRSLNLTLTNELTNVGPVYEAVEFDATLISINTNEYKE